MQIDQLINHLQVSESALYLLEGKVGIVLSHPMCPKHKM